MGFCLTRWWLKTQVRYFFIFLSPVWTSVFFCRKSMYVTKCRWKTGCFCKAVIRITHCAVGLGDPWANFDIYGWEAARVFGEGAGKSLSVQVYGRKRQSEGRKGKGLEGGACVCGGGCQIQEEVRTIQELWAEECGKGVSQADGQEMWKLSIISSAPEFSMTSTLHLQAER